MNDKVGSFIKELRLEKKLTQKELADKLNITGVAVSKWERGLSCPDISLLDDLSKILDVSIIELLKGEKITDKEYLENQDLIDSASYGESVSFNKIYYVVKNSMAGILLLILVVLLFKYFMFFYYRYKKVELNGNLCFDVTSLNEKIDIITSNKGIYNDEDYEIINDYTNRINNFINSQKDEYCEYKKANIDEINSYYNDIFTRLTNNKLSNSIDYIELYIVLMKYDNSSDNYISRISFINSINITINAIVQKIYIRTNSINYDSLSGYSYTHNSIFELSKSINNAMINILGTVLDDIIEAGEYNEK